MMRFGIRAVFMQSVLSLATAVSAGVSPDAGCSYSTSSTQKLYPNDRYALVCAFRSDRVTDSLRFVQTISPRTFLLALQPLSTYQTVTNIVHTSDEPEAFLSDKFKATLSFGQWNMTDENIKYKDVELIRLKARYHTEDGMTLGNDEHVCGNDYAYVSQYDSMTRGDARVLYRQKAALSNNAWEIGDSSTFVIYKHDVTGRNLTSAKMSLACRWTTGGAANIQVSTDCSKWTTLTNISDLVGYCSLKVPESIFPCSALYVRFVGTAKDTILLYSYIFEAKFSGAAVEKTICGSTIYENYSSGARLATAGWLGNDEEYGANLGDGVWTCSSGWKVDERQVVPSVTTNGVRIMTAANEAEAAQVVVKPASVRTGLKVMGTGEGWLEKGMEIFEVGRVRVSEQTDGGGHPGMWADPIFVQAADGVTAKAEVNTAFWIRVKPPKGTPAGVYRGTITLTADGWEKKVPLEVEVWGFELPDRMTLKTAFGLDAWAINRYQHLDSATEAQRSAVYDKYFKSASEHHINPYQITPLCNFPQYSYDSLEVMNDPLNAKPTFDWKKYDAEMERVLGEFHFQQFQLPIPHLGTLHPQAAGDYLGYAFGTPEYEALTGKIYKEVNDHLVRKGWAKMAYTYVFDEPEVEDYEFVKAAFTHLKKYMPDVRMMLTEEPVTAIAGAVDIWCPQLNNYYLGKSAADEARGRGEAIWWYICTQPKYPFVGAFIDHPLAELRTWAWQTWAERPIDTLLYWGTTYWSNFYANELTDPYENGQRRNAAMNVYGNGDGCLFYPPRDWKDGRMNLSGPVETVRLEMLRDAIEDYEYLAMLERELNSATLVTAEERVRLAEYYKDISAITRGKTDFERNPTAMERRREEIGRALSYLAGLKRAEVEREVGGIGYDAAKLTVKIGGEQAEEYEEVRLEIEGGGRNESREAAEGENVFELKGLENGETYDYQVIARKRSGESVLVTQGDFTAGRVGVWTTPEAGRRGIAHFEAEVEILEAMDDAMLAKQLTRLNKFEARGVLAIRTTIDRRLSWRGLISEGDSLVWKELTGKIKPMIGGRFTLAIEYDDTIEGAKVSYLVNGERLKAGDESWFVAPEAGEAQGEIFLVGMSGRSEVRGETTDPNLVEAGGEKYRSLEAALAENESVTPLTGIRWEDTDESYLAYKDGELTVRKGKPANGLSSYVSYVLGLDADDPASLPAVDIRPGGTANLFGVGVDKVTVNPLSGVTPSFSLMDSAEPTGPYEVHAVNETGEFKVDTADDKSKFFKIKIDF